MVKESKQLREMLVIIAIDSSLLSQEYKFIQLILPLFIIFLAQICY